MLVRRNSGAGRLWSRQSPLAKTEASRSASADQDALCSSSTSANARLEPSPSLSTKWWKKLLGFTFCRRFVPANKDAHAAHLSGVDFASPAQPSRTAEAPWAGTRNRPPMSRRERRDCPRPWTACPRGHPCRRPLRCPGCSSACGCPRHRPAGGWQRRRPVPGRARRRAGDVVAEVYAVVADARAEADRRLAPTPAPAGHGGFADRGPHGRVVRGRRGVGRRWRGLPAVWCWRSVPSFAAPARRSPATPTGSTGRRAADNRESAAS